MLMGSSWKIRHKIDTNSIEPSFILWALLSRALRSCSDAVVVLSRESGVTPVVTTSSVEVIRGICRLGERPVNSERLILVGESWALVPGEEAGGGGKFDMSMSRDPVRERVRGET